MHTQNIFKTTYLHRQKQAPNNNCKSTIQLMSTTVKQLKDRLDVLIDAHVWARHNDKVKLNVYQRICLSQERAAIMQLIDEVSYVSRSSDFKVDKSRLKYQIPEHLNQRVQQITNIINYSNWQKPKYEVEPY